MIQYLSTILPYLLGWSNDTIFVHNPPPSSRLVTTPSTAEATPATPGNNTRSSTREPAVPASSAPTPMEVGTESPSPQPPKAKVSYILIACVLSVLGNDTVLVWTVHQAMPQYWFEQYIRQQLSIAMTEYWFEQYTRQWLSIGLNLCASV